MKRTPLRRKAVKLKRSTLARRARVKVKRAGRNAETSAIRAALVERARGWCEAGEVCHAGVTARSPWRIRLRPADMEMDHFWGRRNAEQTVENCWLLCRDCHKAKTENAPDRITWLRAFYRHAQRHGYRAEQERAADAIDVFIARQRLAEMGVRLKMKDELKRVVQVERVVRVDRSPMNPKVWVSQLACGHDRYSSGRKPRVGAALSCGKCDNG